MIDCVEGASQAGLPLAARGEGGRQGSRGAWGKACARVGAIHGVGGGSGGGVRRRRAAGAVGCHPEVVRPARRRRGGSCGRREAGARRRGASQREKGRWRRVMWCSVCMPRECVLIISSRAWWWCGAGARSLVLSETGGEAGVGVSPGSRARGAQEGRRRVGGRITRKWCAGSKSPPAALLAVGGLCCCGGRGWLSVETREHK